MRPIKEIVIHCTATRADWWSSKSIGQKVNEVRKWHVNGNGWSDIGYHYLIDRPGSVAEGRPISKVGAHVKGHNTGTIGIALFGGHGGAATDQFDQHFTTEQDKTLRQLIEKLQKKYGPGLKITGHNQYANKACPCFNAPKWYNAVQNTTPATRPSLMGIFAAFLRFLQSKVKK